MMTILLYEFSSSFYSDTSINSKVPKRSKIGETSNAARNVVYRYKTIVLYNSFIMLIC